MSWEIEIKRKNQKENQKKKKLLKLSVNELIAK
jgi:hypothetical protein